MAITLPSTTRPKSALALAFVTKSSKTMEPRSRSVSTEGEKKTTHPRLYHKKSRNGCQRCRARRVKCDETHPTCGDCTRHRVSCIYDRATTQLSRPPSVNIQPRIITPTPPIAPKIEEDPYNDRTAELLQDYDIPFLMRSMSDACDEMQAVYSGENFMLVESRERRKLELQLLHNFTTYACQTLPGCHNCVVLHIWTVEVPNLAFQCDDLLYPILALSALHLLQSDPHNQELIIARQHYMTLSLQEHRFAISQMTAETADSICLTSTLILADSFASLQYRPIEPYTPPQEWLQMSRGAGSVFGAAFQALPYPNSAKIMAISISEPRHQDLSIPVLDKSENPYFDLMRQDIPTDDVWDEETEDAYEKTIHYLGGMKVALESGEHPLGIARRIIAFAWIAPKKFIDAIDNMHPRAMAVLFLVFSMGEDLEGVWWLWNSAQREKEGIWSTLSLEWRAIIGPLLGKGKKPGHGIGRS